MGYQGQTRYPHDQPQRIGVLITNLGTPDAATPRALRRYLAEFLADPRVVEVPRLLWWLILHGVILRIRPGRSAKLYQKIWTDQGSPLLRHTQAQCDALRDRFQARYGDQLVIDFAMRYGNPSIQQALNSMAAKGVRKLLLLPLYPQYSAATSASTFDALAADFTRRRWLPDLRFVSHYHDFPPYIEAMAQQIETHWAQHGRTQKLLLSYHGVPLRYLHQGDPYHCECLATSRLLATRLGLAETDYLTSFQSRVGREAWLQPYTDHTLRELGANGTQSVAVFCPGFSADCLETLEEIDQENRHYFLAAGGKQFHYIPALNASEGHIAALAQLIEQQLQGWSTEATPTGQLAQRQARAASCPVNAFK